jgi:hypothetical protein
MRRVLLAAATAVALSVPASVAVVGNSSPAFASSSLTCKSMTGTITTTVTISKCNVPRGDGKTYAKATGKASSLAVGGTLTWSSSKKTTIIGKPTVTSPGQGRCASGSTEEDATGSVTGGTAVVTKAGDTFAADVCLNNSTGALSLVPGTTASL